MKSCSRFFKGYHKKVSSVRSTQQLFSNCGSKSNCSLDVKYQVNNVIYKCIGLPTSVVEKRIYLSVAEND